MATKKEIKEAKRLEIVQALLDKGWLPNKEYLEKFHCFKNGQTVTTYYNKVCDLNGGILNDDYYMIAPDKTLALQIKTNVILVHDASRGYCKVLSIQIKDVKITDFALMYNRLALVF